MNEMFLEVHGVFYSFEHTHMDLNYLTTDFYLYFSSFDLGAVHFIVISTEFYYFTDYGSMQIENQWNWLTTDLKVSVTNRDEIFKYSDCEIQVGKYIPRIFNTSSGFTACICKALQIPMDYNNGASANVLLELRFR